MCSETPTHSDIVDLENYIDAIEISIRKDLAQKYEYLDRARNYIEDRAFKLRNLFEAQAATIDKLRQDVDNLSRQVEAARNDAVIQQGVRRHDADSFRQTLKVHAEQIDYLLRENGAAAGWYR